MRLGTIAFLFGILILLRFPELPPASLLYFLPVILLLSFYKPPLRIIGLFFCGFLWALLRAGFILADDSVKDIEGSTLTVIGQVVSLPEQRGDGIRFQFHIKKIISAGHQKWQSPGKVRLNWYHQPELIKPGQFWQLSIRLKRPYGFMNPGGFDYEGWLFQHRIQMTGYVLYSIKNNYLGITNGQLVNRMRQKLQTNISHLLENNPFKGLILGLGLGDRSLITTEQNNVLRNTGTNHLLAISGLHIGLIASLVYFLTCRLWSCGGILPIFIAAPRFAVCTAMLAAFIYASLAGFSIPTQRALIMLLVVMWSLFNYRQYTFTYIISWALILILIIDPFAVMSSGFWLSFSAILVIAYGMLHRVGTESIWWRWGRVQYIVAIGLMPLLIFWFQQYPVSGFLANLIAVPCVSMFVVPLVLAGTLLSSLSMEFSSYFLTGAVNIIELIWPLLEWLSETDFSLFHQASPLPWAFLVSLLGVCIFLQPAGLPARWIGLLWVLPLIFPYKSRPEKNEYWFTLLDVGQGLAAVIQTQNHTLVYDTGAKFSNYFNAGQAAVIPYLRKQKVRFLDLLILSHGDNDHIGGVPDLLRTFPATPVLTSVPEKINHPYLKNCQAGQVWDWDGVRFQVLHPDSLSIFTGNDSSCVLKIDNGTTAILLSGDIERKAEARLHTNLPTELAATILIAPHHGSKTSSTPAFIHHVNPKYALFAVGYRNRFNFPNQDIISRYESRGIEVLDTALHGAIIVKTATAGISVQSYRQMARRFWHTKF